MKTTESKMPSIISRFFVENHTENDDVVDELHRIEDFVDKLGKGKDNKINKGKPEQLEKQLQKPKELGRLR